MAPPPDYATWLTKQQAADAIGVSTKTVEKFAQDHQLQQAVWRRPTGGPARAVYHPEDVARLAAARQSGPPRPFVVPAENPATRGNGDHGAEALTRVPPVGGSGEDLLRALVVAALRVVSESSEKSEKVPALFLTLPQAAALSGLSQTYLRRQIAEGTLPATRDRGWRIRRRDLEAL